MTNSTHTVDRPGRSPHYCSSGKNVVGTVDFALAKSYDGDLESRSEDNVEQQRGQQQHAPLSQTLCDREPVR